MTRTEIVVEGTGGPLDRIEVEPGNSPAYQLILWLMVLGRDLAPGDVIRVEEVEL
jgi:hypothetical protein